MRWPVWFLVGVLTLHLLPVPTAAGDALGPTVPPMPQNRLACFQDRAGHPVAGVELFLGQVLAGVSDETGCLSVAQFRPGLYTYTLYFRSGNGNNGMRGGLSLSRQSGERQTIRVDTTPAGSPLANVALPEAVSAARQTRVTLQFASEVPPGVRTYLEALQADLDPVLRRLMGPPLQEGTLRIVYDPARYASLSGDLSELYVTRLPRLLGENDPDFDAWFLVEYAHKYLQGREVPILTSRSLENISHAIRAVAGTYLNQQGIRRIATPGVAYYSALRPVLETLGSGILLNTGPQTARNAGGSPNGAEWEDGSYQRMNPTTIEYALSVWLALAEARFRESGQLDFFRRFQDAMLTVDPRSPAAFFALITEVVGARVEGMEAGEWLRRTSLFQGLPDATHFVRPLPVRGSFWYIAGMNDPDRIYLLAVRRPPATLLPGSVRVTLRDGEQRVVAAMEASLSFRENGEPASVPVPPGLPPGSYTATITGVVDGVGVEASQRFEVTGAGR